MSPEVSVVWLTDSDVELLAATSNWLAVNRIFSGRLFTGWLCFVKVGQGGVLRKADTPKKHLRSRSLSP